MYRNSQLDDKMSLSKLRAELRSLLLSMLIMNLVNSTEIN